ncbi:hypothetical protein FB446DRAFT_794279 [Lentinula raphanica]|nr:hypothetical protein FB446DRAFT_794279 [Lentinula raphanica]
MPNVRFQEPVVGYPVEPGSNPLPPPSTQTSAIISSYPPPDRPRPNYAPAQSSMSSFLFGGSQACSQSQTSHQTASTDSSVQTSAASAVCSTHTSSGHSSAAPVSADPSTHASAARVSADPSAHASAARVSADPSTHASTAHAFADPSTHLSADSPTHASTADASADPSTHSSAASAQPTFVDGAALDPKNAATAPTSINSISSTINGDTLTPANVSPPSCGNATLAPANTATPASADINHMDVHRASHSSSDPISGQSLTSARSDGQTSDSPVIDEVLDPLLARANGEVASSLTTPENGGSLAASSNDAEVPAVKKNTGYSEAFVKNTDELSGTYCKKL